MTVHNMQIFRVGPGFMQQNSVGHQLTPPKKQISSLYYFSSIFILYYIDISFFYHFNCCLTVVLLLEKGAYPEYLHVVYCHIK